MGTLPRRLLAVLKKIAVVYFSVCVAMWALQREMLYLPETDIAAPETYGLTGFTDLRFAAADGVVLQAWHHPPRAGFPTIIYFHGNGGHLGYRTTHNKAMVGAGFGLLALGYRGYGMSEGSPSEQGFYADARAAIAYARDVLKLSPAQMIFYGESIGTGVAVQMATEFASAALVLQSPYSSITDLAGQMYPWLPVRLLLKDTFDSIHKIPAVRAPVLVLHGMRDTVVPVAMGEAVFAAVTAPKQAIYPPTTGHNDFDWQAITAALEAFCRAQAIL